ncbi:MAG: hypothetical protein J6U68_04200 [Clostridia bacterium]|nr:hypothetical protein [Clostridia bacterium]
MRFKKIVSTFIAFCLMATLAVAMSGCYDLGAYEDEGEYYDAFGDIVLINGSTKERKKYSVEKYFYNEDSQEDFLEGEDGAYKGVPSGEYVYMAIPFKSIIDMDILAMYMCSESDATVYINVFVTDEIPSSWKSIEDNIINNEKPDVPSAETDELPEAETDGLFGDESEKATDITEEIEKVYDDPDPDTRVGDLVVHLKAGKWDSFLLDKFVVNGSTKNSIEIKKGQYILLQFRNNSGVREFDEEKQSFFDPQTGIQLPKVEITMTNLLIRALDIKNVNETQGGE